MYPIEGLILEPMYVPNRGGILMKMDGVIAKLDGVLIKFSWCYCDI